MKARMLIGLHGYAGSGKSLIAQEILTKFPGVVLPFAEALKQVALSLGWNGEKDQKGRRLLQILGTEVCRECIDINYWVHKWRERYYQIPLDATVLVDDVRFPNEAECIRALGGKVFHIKRRKVSRWYDHASEAELPPDLIDQAIDNDGVVAQPASDILYYMKENEKWL